MKVEIIVRTGKGEESTEVEVSKTFKEVLEIARAIKGKIIEGKGYSDGTKIIIEK